MWKGGPREKGAMLPPCLVVTVGGREGRERPRCASYPQGMLPLRASEGEREGAGLFALSMRIYPPRRGFH
jgi:hypothetical protein